jgi:CubicO group peptidase (beta-lactamase class C family)
MDISLAVLENGALTRSNGVSVLVPWWSFTKTVIAAGALALVRDGRLTLDEPLAKRPYSLRQLLQHRAGVTNYGELAAYHQAVERGDDPWPVAEVLERTGADRLRHAPGQGWQYSNIGYLFVRRLIEDTCGEPLGAALSRLVLSPLGIKSARIAETPDDLANVFMGAGGTYHPGWVYHGLMVGRLDEAAILLHRLLTGRLLPDHLLDQMCIAFVLSGPVPGRPWNATGYALGLMIGTTGAGTRVIGHSGGGPGSVIAVYQSRDAAPVVTVAAFSSGDDLAGVENAGFAVIVGAAQ